VQQLFHLKFWIPTEMLGRDLTLTDKITLLEQIKNTSLRQLTEINVVPKSTIARVTQQQEKLRDEWMLRHRQQGNFVCLSVRPSVRQLARPPVYPSIYLLIYRSTALCWTLASFSVS
jgi:hypothetical protein